MIGRIAGQAELRSLLDEPESVFAAVYGRRRVGKTYLARKAFGNSFAFDHVGMSSGKMSWAGEGLALTIQLNDIVGGFVMFDPPVRRFRVRLQGGRNGKFVEYFIGTRKDS